ncbi:hypothetical protein ACHAXR_009428 [Thalassiosira sp. AJA248-18]
MVNIYVARHGQDVDNSNGILNGHRNEPLTDLGREQARDVGHKMSKAGFTLSSSSSGDADADVDADASSSSALASASITALNAIYSSPLKRAHETAEIFVNILSGSDGGNNNNIKKVEVLDDLIERDFGIMTGQPTSSIVEKCGGGADHILATEKINYFLDPKGAETFPDLIDRANRLLAHIQNNDKINDSSSSSSSSSILLVTHGDFGKMLYAAYYNLPWEEVLRQFHFGNSEVLLLAKYSPPERAHVFETLQFNA